LQTLMDTGDYELKNINVHYHNLIEINTSGNSVNTDEYFRIVIRAPAVLEPVHQFDLILTTTAGEDESNVLFLVFGKAPSEPGVHRFRMDWHARAIIKEFDMVKIKDTIRESHDVILEAFNASFTDAGLELLGIKSGDERC
jgi:hypothetical protein